MATVEKIVPCICTQKQRNKTEWYDFSVYHGMPQLKVSDGITEHTQFWSAFCPSCKRGGCIEYKSPYFALKHWNEMQTELWKNEEIVNVD